MQVTQHAFGIDGLDTLCPFCIVTIQRHVAVGRCPVGRDDILAEAQSLGGHRVLAPDAVAVGAAVGAEVDVVLRLALQAGEGVGQGVLDVDLGGGGQGLGGGQARGAADELVVRHRGVDVGPGSRDGGALGRQGRRAGRGAGLGLQREGPLLVDGGVLGIDAHRQRRALGGQVAAQGGHAADALPFLVVFVVDLHRGAGAQAEGARQGAEVGGVVDGHRDRVVHGVDHGVAAAHLGVGDVEGRDGGLVVEGGAEHGGGLGVGVVTVGRDGEDVGRLGREAREGHAAGPLADGEARLADGGLALAGGRRRGGVGGAAVDGVGPGQRGRGRRDGRPRQRRHLGAGRRHVNLDIVYEDGAVVVIGRGEELKRDGLSGIGRQRDGRGLGEGAGIRVRTAGAFGIGLQIGEGAAAVGGHLHGEGAAGGVVGVVKRQHILRTRRKRNGGGIYQGGAVVYIVVVHAEHLVRAGTVDAPYVSGGAAQSGGGRGRVVPAIGYRVGGHVLEVHRPGEDGDGRAGCLEGRHADGGALVASTAVGGDRQGAVGGVGREAAEGGRGAADADGRRRGGAQHRLAQLHHVGGARVAGIRPAKRGPRGGQVADGHVGHLGAGGHRDADIVDTSAGGIHSRIVQPDKQDAVGSSRQGDGTCLGVPSCSKVSGSIHSASAVNGNSAVDGGPISAISDRRV